MNRRSPLSLLGPMPPMPPLEPPKAPPGFRLAFGLMSFVVCVIIVGTLGRSLLLESGAAAPEAQLRGESDAVDYVHAMRPSAVELRARCVVSGVGEMPCTVTGREGLGVFSESVLCRTSIAIGPRGCWRGTDRTITIEQSPAAGAGSSEP